MNWIDFFTDPVLRAPTWGTLFMCIASSLMGVILFLKKKTLIAESLSHAAYPGVILGVCVCGFFFPLHEEWAFAAVLVGAFLSSLIALKTIQWLQIKAKVPSDAALCFVLALFFGVGVVFASAMQTILPAWHKHIQTLLFGQAATMTDIHILLYALLGFSAIVFIGLVFYPLQALLFDREFAAASGIPVAILVRLIFILLLVSLIVGMRSVGVVLMSGMVIAPAVAARQFTDRLHKMLFLAAIFGALSGLFGNILSVVGSLYFSTEIKKMIFPTGPMIVLVGTSFAFLSLCFAPKRGWVFRKIRIYSFRLRCLEENLLKGMWKKGSLPFSGLQEMLRISRASLFFVLKRLVRHGWLVHEKGIYFLTFDGKRKASSIVRLHRLFELYLAETLQLQVEKVHKTAEEMEHILTPDLEARLTQLLANPKKDPHQQPIPEKI